MHNTYRARAVVLHTKGVYSADTSERMDIYIKIDGRWNASTLHRICIDRLGDEKHFAARAGCEPQECREWSIITEDGETHRQTVPWVPSRHEEPWKITAEFRPGVVAYGTLSRRPNVSARVLSNGFNVHTAGKGEVGIIYRSREGDGHIFSKDRAGTILDMGVPASKAALRATILRAAQGLIIRAVNNS